MIKWAAANKVGFLQLLPINETGADNSPYNAISSVALDPLLIDLEAIPEIEASDIKSIAKELGIDSNTENLVDYETVRTAKWGLLAKGFDAFWATELVNTEFDAFCIEEAEWLVPYCQVSVAHGDIGNRGVGTLARAI